MCLLYCSSCPMPTPSRVAFLFIYLLIFPQTPQITGKTSPRGGPPGSALTKERSAAGRWQQLCPRLRAALRPPRRDRRGAGRVRAGDGAGAGPGAGGSVPPPYFSSPPPPKMAADVGSMLRYRTRFDVRRLQVGGAAVPQSPNPGGGSAEGGALLQPSPPAARRPLPPPALRHR